MPLFVIVSVIMRMPVGVFPRVLVRMAVVALVDMKFPAGDPAPRTPVKMGVEAFGETHGIERGGEDILRDPEVAQGAHAHVAGDSGKTIKEKNSHGNLQGTRA